MRRTIALAIAAATSMIAAASPAAAASQGAYDPITAVYRPADNTYCIRSGWGSANAAANRLVRKGDCHSATEWRRYGVEMHIDGLAPTLARNDTAAKVATR